MDNIVRNEKKKYIKKTAPISLFSTSSVPPPPEYPDLSYRDSGYRHARGTQHRGVRQSKTWLFFFALQKKKSKKHRYGCVHGFFAFRNFFCWREKKKKTCANKHARTGGTLVGRPDRKSRRHSPRRSVDKFAAGAPAIPEKGIAHSGVPFGSVFERVVFCEKVRKSRASEAINHSTGRR